MKNTPFSTVPFPARYVVVPPDGAPRRASFYLAAEEFLARTAPLGQNYFFTWQVGPTVVMGRHQHMASEVVVDFCRAEGIDVCRRRSGGGCIFADGGNIMSSLITAGGSVETLFAAFSEGVAGVLRRAGAPVELSGRNDVVLSGGGKVCGGAFYHLPGRSIVHATMLYDADLRLMAGALRPDEGKLRARGVKSVRSRVALLKEVLPSGCGVAELRRALRDTLCSGPALELTGADVADIRRREQAYRAASFIEGSASAADLVRSARVEGCGRVEFRWKTDGERIDDLRLSGDFFDDGRAGYAFARVLQGARFTPEDVAARLADAHPEQHIRGLTARDVMSILFQELP